MEEQKITREMVDKMSDKELRQLIQSLLDNFDNSPLMKKMTNEDNIYLDIMDATRNKRGKSEVQRVIGTEYENVFRDENNMLLKTIRNIQLLLLTESFYPRQRDPIIVKDRRKANKERKIYKPDIEDEHLIHHVLIRTIMPELRKGMYRYSCASIPGRGIHFLRKHVSKAIKNDPKNTKYVLQMDIRNFFDSIPHRILKKRLRNIVKDETVRKLLFRIIDTTDKGLPIGFYTSQWLANFYLQPLDHYIKERILVDCGCNTARTGRYGAVYYYRYMDDLIVFGPNKKELHKMRNRIQEVLDEEYGLKLRYNWQVFRLDYIDKKTKERKGRPLDFVGFQFYHDKITIRKTTYKKIMKLIHKLIRKGVENISFHDAASMLSYYGFIYWSDAKGLYTNLLRPHVRLKDLKRIVKNEFNRRLLNPIVEEEYD